jgi:hypothetical protein
MEESSMSLPPAPKPEYHLFAGLTDAEPHPTLATFKNRVRWGWLAERLCCGESTVSKWLNGRDPIPHDKEAKLYELEAEVIEYARDHGHDAA